MTNHGSPTNPAADKPADDENERLADLDVSEDDGGSVRGGALGTSGGDGG